MQNLALSGAYAELSAQILLVRGTFAPHSPLT